MSEEKNPFEESVRKQMEVGTLLGWQASRVEFFWWGDDRQSAEVVVTGTAATAEQIETIRNLWLQVETKDFPSTVVAVKDGIEQHLAGFYFRQDAP